jgi:hypothetical protein
VIYVGIDLHRKRSHIAAVDECGVQVLSRRIVNDADVVEEVVAELGEEAKFALEATYGWEWLAQLLDIAAASCMWRIRCAPRRSRRRA